LGNSAERVNPRYTNRGVGHTSLNPLRACLDWVQGTLKIENYRLIFELFNIPEEGWNVSDKGMMMYRKKMTHGKIVVLWDGINEDMGVHFILSGEACRQFESIYPFGWHRFLVDVVQKYAGQFSRIDAAIDDFHGYYSVRAMRGKVKRGEVSSRFKNMEGIEKIRIRDGENVGHSVYFGADSSDVQIRIYDKKQEREAKGVEVEEGVENWVRTELQLRNKRSHAFAVRVIKSYSNGNKELENNVGLIIAGVLKKMITVRTRNKSDDNKGRWPICKWWSDYLGDVAKISLADRAPDLTLEQTKKWFEQQSPRTLAKLYLAMSSDDKYIDALIKKGIQRLTESDIHQIDSYLIRFAEEGADDGDPDN
jgi:phage replication initiation protein